MKQKRRRSMLRWLGVAMCVAAYCALPSCKSFEGVHVPEKLLGIVPGATYVGSESCAACHEAQARYFKHDAHASVTVNIESETGATVNVEGCEACHGPGSIHAEEDGLKAAIMRENTERCFACHLDIKAKLKLQHHHPVLEGRMTCSDCHGSHGKDSRATVSARLKRSDETCFECHKEMKGPFVFEHEAMREGCSVCHDPHGSIQDKLLVAGQSTTCLRCHYDITTNPSGNLSGGVAHGSTASTTGAGGGNYDIGRGEECIDHHRAPHGSQIWRTFNR